ncbi:MAG: A/G-specific adenine glycosylase [Alphaproteobacteria bacterium]
MSSPSSKAIKRFHTRLYEWYAVKGRKTLPWRNTRDDYAIYVSEIMLQQTQVKTVLKHYYKPFLKRFPTLKSLAKAKRSDVMKAWQGLGYYSRAANMHETAKLCNGALPQDVKELMSLPGIGQNTAHAIAAFAHYQPVAVMEANVRRVVTRIFALSSPTPALLWKKADQLLDTTNPFDYNQAMMDLGSMVCTRTAPQCTICPANTICAGKFSPLSFPKPASAKKVPVRRKNIIVFTNHRGEIYASTRDGKFLTGLFHFIEAPVEQKSVAFMDRRFALARARHIGHIRQQYSHFTLEADVYAMHAGNLVGKNWHTLARFKALPKSVVETKIMALLHD